MKGRFFLLLTFLFFVLSNPVYAQNWTQLNFDGFGDVNNHGVGGFIVYDDHVYVGTLNEITGGEVWRYDGTTWAQVNTTGFGDAINSICSMGVYDNCLYVGTCKENIGWCEVWKYDGSTWIQVNSDGFGDANNFIAVDMGIYKNLLYVGTINGDTGAEVWRFGDVAVNYSDYFPVDPEKYKIKTFQWTFGKTGQFTSRIEGTKTVPYVSGELSGVRVTNFPEYEWVWIIYNDGVNVKYLGYELRDEPEAPLDSYYLSTDCSLADHPSVYSFNTLIDGMIIDQGTYYTVKSDFSDCEMDNDQMILISIQDVTVLEGNYENAVIMWYLDTKYPFTPFDPNGEQYKFLSDLGINLPTSSDTNGYSITAFGIDGFETGPIAGGDISAYTGDLNKVNELCQVIDYVKIAINLPAGWSMISLPVAPLNATVSTLFPEAAVMYGFDRESGYLRVQEDEDLQVGSGYWIHVYEDQNYVLTGQPIQSYSKTIYSDGWEMIGGCTSDAKASVDNCGIGVIYRFVQGTGYQRVLDSEKLEACGGFWIKIKDVTDECELTVTGDSTKISLRNDGFYFNGKKWFIVGGNWRMIEYGQNFGVTAWFPDGNGVSLHRELIDTRLEVFRQAGITLIRVGLLDDGRTIFDINGNVVGFNDKFREDVSTILDLAKEKDIMVEFAIADFLIAGKEEEINGVWLRGRREIIEDPQIRTKFITDFFEPFLCEFGSHPALFGFDLMNEPEWIISSSEGGGWEDVSDDSKDTSPINLVDLYTFFNESINKIRQLAPKKFITVGVSIKFMDLVKNLDLDYLALHYYPWMGEINKLLSDIPDSEVWLLEEFPGTGNITDYLNAVYDVGGNGALLWNLSPEIDDQSYLLEEEESKLLEVRAFVDKTDCTDITIKLCPSKI